MPEPAPASPRALPWRRAGLAALAVVLALHVRAYAFLCDDAFISFRYAKNLAAGHGLVFNPGFERVEGYSDFLWVLVLALLDRLGLRPETTALPLSWAATLALFAVVADFARRRALPAAPAWTTLIAPALLAVTRSFAVWASSGLETRVFELCVVAGALRLVDEVEAERDDRPLRPLAAWLLGLGALNRPDGILLAGCALAAAAAFLARAGKLDARRFARGAAPAALLIGGHFAFRLGYYGEWLPNTYYAKVDGTWWDAGLRYLEAFTLEYAAYLWIPLVALGARALAAAGKPFAPLLFAAVVLPHAVYVAAIGGDHFEYRPLDLYLPFLFLLAGAGAASVATSPRRAAGAGAYLALVVLGLVDLPWQSHAQYPARYVAGFPGKRGLAEPERLTYLAPGRGTLHRLPGFRALAALHLELLRGLSEQYIGLRQEEHAGFLATVEPEGKRLRALVDEGILPADTHLATGSVGAIPYFSGLRTLDRLGLTDARVARSAPGTERKMAHNRGITLKEAGGYGVELWAAHQVHFLWPIDSVHLIDLVARRRPFFAAETAPGEILAVMLAQGPEAAATRFPRVHFQAGGDDAHVSRLVQGALARLRARLAAQPEDLEAQKKLAAFLFFAGDAPGALAAHERVLAREPGYPEAMISASMCRQLLGRPDEARAGLTQGLALARAAGDAETAAKLEKMLAAPPLPPLKP
jgi:arabinofuranosyltransferase